MRTLHVVALSLFAGACSPDLSPESEALAQSEAELTFYQGTPVPLIIDATAQNGLYLIDACKYPDTDQACVQRVQANKHLYKNPFSTVVNPSPKWSVSQWGSQSSLSTSTHQLTGTYDKLYTNDKSFTVYKTGALGFSMNGVSEFGNVYPPKGPGTPSLYLSQKIAEPGGHFTNMPPLSSLKALNYRFELRKTASAQNLGSGYNSADNALIVMTYFTIQYLPVTQTCPAQLNTCPSGYGNYIWVGIGMYDDRSDYANVLTPDYSGYDPGTGKWIFNVGMKSAGSGDTNLGTFTMFDADVYPHIMNSFNTAVAAHLFDNTSKNPADFRIGSYSVGYELTGLNQAAFDLQNLSLTGYPAKTVPTTYVESVPFIDGNVTRQGNTYVESGTNLVLNEDGSSAELILFTPAQGTASISAVVGPNRGLANVFWDNGLVQTLDLWAANYGAKTFPVVTNATAGTHVLKVVRTGLSSHDSQTTRYAVLTTAFSRPGVFLASVGFNDSRVTKMLNWFLEGSSVVLAQDGAFAEVGLHTNGGTVSLSAIHGPNRGIADLYVDGALVKSLDMRAASYGTVVTPLAMSPGDHSLRIVRSGRTSGTDRYLVLTSLTGN